MNSPKVLETALAAARSPIMLETPAQVSRAAKAWRRSQALGLDTEFVRERTYYANLGLVQISDGQTVWLVDPLQEGTTEPVRELLEDAGIIKIFHSPSEDLEVLRHSVGAVPAPLIDTQQALAILGEPLQLGYHMAVEKLFDVEVDKGLTRSNWVKRPLAPNLLHYAALDVCLLPLMWRTLARQLRDLDRMAWLEEDCERQVRDAQHPTGPAAAWQRIKGIGTLDGASLAALKTLATWREKEARKRNRPRGFIVTDQVLLNIARRKLTDPSALEELDDLHPRARQRYGASMINMVESILANGKTLPVLPQLDHAQRRLLKMLRQQTQDVAADLGVEPTLLAARRELEQLIFRAPGDSLPARLRGWRKPIITDPLMQVLSD